MCVGGARRSPPTGHFPDCVGCQAAKYCSETHQLKHWNKQQEIFKRYMKAKRGMEAQKEKREGYSKQAKVILGCRSILKQSSYTSTIT